MQGILMWPWYAIAWINGVIIKKKFKFVILILICALIFYVDATTPIAEHRVLRSSKIINIYDKVFAPKQAIETSLQTIHDIATENLGTLCVSQSYRPLKISINAERYEGARQKADLAAVVLQDVGVNRHGGLLDALAKGLLSDPQVIAARILATNVTTGVLGTSVWWTKHIGGLGGPNRVDEDGVAVGTKPSNNYPWYADESSSPDLRSPKFALSPPNISYRGWWTFPYYSCNQKRWILSYSVAIPPIGRHGMRGFLSIDIDVSELQVNQCEITHRNELDTYQEQLMQIEAFHGSNKCHRDNMKCEYRPLLNTIGQTILLYTNLNSYNINSNSNNNNNLNSNSNNNINNKNLINVNGWLRGAYQCLCKQGYYSIRHPYGFNGTIMEVAYQEYKENVSRYYQDMFRCLPCAKGCDQCFGPSPCLATYNWPFRISILTISILCAIFTLVLACYMFKYRKVKVFKVASPIFLTITLLGCAIMYLEMAAIFPILDTYACIATKWTRHMGFCVTYTALLMKTWRVSLTYRVKSAHKVKLTDKQLLQWMVPILLVMLIYLGTWTLSAPPIAEVITDQYGLKFKQCSYNWWDHSLAIGEVLFLAWGIRVCYNVRNAESLYNEARLISFAIYNIALVNTLMVAIHLFIFPQAGPDIKYLLGFVRTQLSTTVTIALVFVPKVIRIIRGQGDQWDSRAKVRGITASFSLNGIGLVPDDSPDLYQENEELKEEIQKLAAQIEFMKIVNMEMNNRHLKPKPGGYFTISSTVQSPLNKSTNTQIYQSKKSQTPHQQQIEQLNNSGGISDDGHSGSNSLGTNSIGYAPPTPQQTSVQNNNNNNNNTNMNNNNNNNGNTTTNNNEKV